MNLRPVCISAILMALVLTVVNCGRDTVAPSDPASTADIPPVVFFHSSPGAEIALRGTVSDNVKVAEVSVAINGTSFATATIEPPGGAQTVDWTYMATAAELPAGANTVLVRAVDSSDNETVSSPIIVESTMGSTIDSLLAVLSVPRLADTIGLSTGSGQAFGNSATSWTIPIDAGLTLSGAGSATILEADISHPVLFSVSANLNLKNMVVRGAQVGVEVSDPSADPEILIENCLFDGQGAWAIDAVDDEGTNVQFLSSTVDASAASSASRGGLYLEGVTYYLVADSVFTGHTDPGGPADGTVEGAAVQVVGSSGQITESIFDGNALAIWASGGTPLIDSCSISGAAYTTYGINLTGGPGTPILQYNHISGNSGYGTRIGGEMTPVFYRNVITLNKESGVLVDFTGTLQNAGEIVLGDNDKKSTTGFNDIFDNVYPGITGKIEVYVTEATPNDSKPYPVYPIKAHNNYWGATVQDFVNARTYDNFDTVPNDRLALQPTFFTNSRNND
ncbi:MAG: right-handed parallel beta-helix repeat-containing protein [bacterium]|nr:right-handed parallel beta-helix repeat-containing protein [bacterium]